MILPACYHEPAPFRFFTESEAACLIGVCECIIPADDTPGATDAGVIYYIDRQLMGHFFFFFYTYRRGLSALQNSCRQRMGTAFEKLSFERQTLFLELVEQGDEGLVGWEDEDPVAFFNMVISHTRQGFYGAPRHGGNKDYVSYRILGIGYPQVVGQNRYGKGDSNG